MVPAKAGISGPDADEAAVSGAASASSRGSQSAAAWMAVAQTRTSFQLLPSFAASHPGSAPVVRVAGETIDCFWNKRRLHVAWGPFGSSGWLVCDSQASCALRHRRSASYSAEVLASASSPVLASCDVEFHFHVDRENQLTKTDLHHLLYRAIQELPRSSSSSSAASSARTTTGAAAGSGSGSGSGSAAAAAAASRAAAAATATRRSVANVLATVLALAEFRDEVFLDEPELSARLLQLARAVAFPKLDKLVALLPTTQIASTAETDDSHIDSLIEGIQRVSLQAKPKTETKQAVVESKTSLPGDSSASSAMDSSADSEEITWHDRRAIEACEGLVGQISGIDRIDPFLKSEPWFVKLAEDLRPNITTDRNHSAIYLHRLLTVAHKFWAQSSRLSLSHVLSPREAAAFLSNFCSSTSAFQGIAPNQQQWQRLVDMTLISKEGLNLRRFAHMVLNLGDPFQFKQGQEPHLGDVIDLISESVHTHSVWGPRFMLTALMNRRERIEYVLLHNCGFVFGLSTGHQEIKHGNTAVPLQLTTGRLNLVATICPHERCPDDHMQLIGSDCNNSPCFLDFKAGADRPDSTPLSDLDAVIPMLEGIQQTLMQSKSKTAVPMIARLAVVRGGRYRSGAMESLDVAKRLADVLRQLNRTTLALPGGKRARSMAEFGSDVPRISGRAAKVRKFDRKSDAASAASAVDVVSVASPESERKSGSGSVSWRGRPRSPTASADDDDDDSSASSAATATAVGADLPAAGGSAFKVMAIDLSDLEGAA